MLRPVILHRVTALVRDCGGNAFLSTSGRISRLKAKCCNPPNQQCRPLSVTPRCGISSTSKDMNEGSRLPEAPPLSQEEIEFIEECARGIVEPKELDDGGSSPLPEAPEVSVDWNGYCSEEVAEDETVLDIEAVPYIPPSIKRFMRLEIDAGIQRKLLMSKSEGGKNESESGAECVTAEEDESPSDLGVDPSMVPLLAAWARAVAPTPASSPMPLHELANRSIKIKELVKLGVDMATIVKRHAHMERLLHLSWEDQIKPQIRFLVDCGIEPDCLGVILTRNTPLLWTDKDDIRVRMNYLESKLFTPEEIKNIVNKAPFWLTLETKEVDKRLGFLQRIFKLPGSDVRFIASSFPTIVSSRRWDIFVNTTKLLDREFGFTPWERKALLFKKPQCYMRPLTVRLAFDYCHNQIGLTHNQLVKHASLLLNRASRTKPRHQFLKFLKRDNFNTNEPNYISPDWLWQGSVSEFCEIAAKSTVEDFEFFLKNATTS